MIKIIQISDPENHEQKKAILLQQYSERMREGNTGGRVGLEKKTSNLFRFSKGKSGARLNVRSFNSVLSIDPESLVCETEGMITYEDLVAVTLQYGFLPAVVPELKTITIGGAVSGIGIESSSFRYGLVHETILEMEILLPDGRAVRATPDNKYADLFYGFPNSYGTLGYILKLKVRLIRTSPFVRLTHRRYRDPESYFRDLKRLCLENRKHSERTVDFIDGVVFSGNELVITLGKFTEQAPYSSNYKYMNIYYKSLLKREEDYVTVSDYIWRWDTDWFWCSRGLYFQNPLLRLLLGPWFLKSAVYWKILSLVRRSGVRDTFHRLFRSNTTFEPVIQDVDIPVDRAPDFLEFFHREVGILPVWICPVASLKGGRRFDLYHLPPGRLYINFGFWSELEIPGRHEDGWINKKIEDEVEKWKGLKSLYSTSFYDEQRFWRLYNGKSYARLKRKYDPHNRLADLYQKCVKRT